MIVISHDREFLDAVTNVTLHIERQQLTRYGGNYSAFETLRAQQLELQQSAFSKQKEKIAHLQKFIDRFKAKASKAKQAQSRVKALERMEKIAPVLADAEFTFEFKEPANLPNPMLAISDGQFGYVRRRPSPSSSSAASAARCMAGQRIGILGANGQGKSTLVKTIARDIARAGRHHHRGQGPEHRLLRAAGTGRAAPAGHAAGTHVPPGARSRRRTPANPAASRTCATSWAPSTSAATWSSRPWAP